jgi:hypothetical protein
MRGTIPFLVTFVVLLVFPHASWAGKASCVTGEPEFAAGDPNAIAALKAQIDAACQCQDYDGTARGKKHGDFVRCAKSLILQAIESAALRKQCRGTMIKIYAKSTCGFPEPEDSAKAKVPCVKQLQTNGKVICAIKPQDRCVDKPGRYTQEACLAHDFCLEAADDNENFIFLRDPTGGDDGSCAGGGDCLSCHSRVAGDRRPVVDDFSAPGSHHIQRDPNTVPLNKFDCVICHLEGDSNGDTTEYHEEEWNGPNHVVNLRNVDDPNDDTLRWDDLDDANALKLSPNGAPADCGSPNDRTHLTTFCQSCHDQDGFGDTTFLDEIDINENDPNVTRSQYDPFGDGRSPMDIKSLFDPNQYSTHSISCRESAGVLESGQKLPAFPGIASEAWENGWDEMATTECADCHMPGGDTGGAGSFSQNAHGSSHTRYLLDTADGTDSPVIDTSDPNASNIVCLKCHSRLSYLAGSTNSRYPHHDEPGHQDPFNNWLSSPAGGDTGTGCFNCHAGSGAGSIHGESDSLTDDQSPFGHEAAIFLNGACLDLWLYEGGDPPSFSLSVVQTAAFPCLKANMFLIPSYTRQY